MAYVEGNARVQGESAYTRDEAKEYFLQVSRGCQKLFIYLSARCGATTPSRKRSIW